MTEHFKKLKALLAKHEGLKLKPYKDSMGKLTIGVGRNLEDVGISEKEADELLANDIMRCHDQAFEAFDWYPALDDARQDVILSMIFNLGMHGFVQFKKTIQAIASKDFELASREMMDSHWASQVGKRAYELSEMMRLGTYLGGETNV